MEKKTKLPAGFITDRIVYFKNVFAIGQVWIKLPIDMANASLVMEFSNFIKLNFPQYSSIWMAILPIAVCCWIAGCYYFGRWLEKEKHIVHSETKFSADRTDKFENIVNSLQDIQSRLRRIEGKI